MSAPTPSGWATGRAAPLVSHTHLCVVGRTNASLPCRCGYDARMEMTALALDTARESGRRERDAEVAELRAEVGRIRAEHAEYLVRHEADRPHVLVIGDPDSPSFPERIAEALRSGPTVLPEPVSVLNPDTLRRLEALTLDVPESTPNRAMRRAKERR